MLGDGVGLAEMSLWLPVPPVLGDGRCVGSTQINVNAGRLDSVKRKEKLGLYPQPVGRRVELY